MTKEQEISSELVRGKIFVHIGLPKTATTTLQREIFPTLDGAGVRYLGVFQPRAQEQMRTYEQFCRVVNSGADGGYLRASLAKELDQGTSLLVSEEMFTVSSNALTWREKLQHLAKLLVGLDYEIVVTVREPATAMFSYFVETYETFAPLKRSFSTLARSHERMEVFHYRKFCNVLRSTFDTSRIHIYRFEDIIAGKSEDLCRFITGNRRGWCGTVPTVTNYRSRVGDIVYSTRKVTLGDIPRRVLFALGISEHGLVLAAKGVLRPLTRSLDQVRLARRGFEVPSDLDVQSLRNDLHHETVALNEYFHVKY